MFSLAMVGRAIATPGALETKGAFAEVSGGGVAKGLEKLGLRDLKVSDMYICIYVCMYVSIYLSTYLSIYLSIYVKMFRFGLRWLKIN